MDLERLVQYARECEVDHYDIALISGKADPFPRYDPNVVEGSIRRIRLCVRAANRLLDYLEAQVGLRPAGW